MELDDPAYAPVAGEDPPQAVADAMHGAWVAFAATGDPGWAAYGPERRATMVFGGGRPGVAEDLRAAERELWEGVR
ncbi:hypothetical protein [Streptomyces sp. NPDC050856]|uniref:hypothetical protein n=1 Tax=Streptomyces sp. NPDC050856 TaxID=3154939 RepID=UPI0033C3D498